MKQSKLLVTVLLGLLIVGAGGGYYVYHTERQAAIAKKRQTDKALNKKAALKNSQLSRKINQTTFSNNKNTDEQVTKALNLSHFVGSALVVKDDHVIYNRAFGYANKAKNQRNKVNSKYQILSIQKSMTAVGIMQLVQAGKVKLTDPISKYYPTLKHGRQTTLRQMLDMTTGFRLKSGSKEFLPENQVIDFAAHNVFYYPDKNGIYNYSSVNFLLLAGIIRKVTSQSYQHFFTTHFIDKLNLNETGFLIHGQGQDATTGYRALADQTLPNYDQTMPESKAQMANELGTGQVYMSTADLFTVESAILKGQLLSKKNVAILHTRTATGEYGGGVYNMSNGIRSHGLGYGYESSIFLSPDGKTGVVLMSNYYRKAAGIQATANKIFTELMKGDIK
ncbi:Putative penicillin-binding protein PbpX [Lactiplantibacillus plantarum]|nr:Putative penicillin-binding protein PbpX [Lactiplantibacillus plantarum]SPE10701.1 Putative penicillin-binding protein PbpX [Lactiplantibacillus plantarum]SPH05636.1 Putative penicillin-binding protein PbpX [Lactiplantibacillus plantarum]SPH08835.1 Putative penicillin-binding protein PbpX [Lactiplantibacillus plantarum]